MARVECLPECAVCGKSVKNGIKYGKYVVHEVCEEEYVWKLPNISDEKLNLIKDGSTPKHASKKA